MARIDCWKCTSNGIHGEESEMMMLFAVDDSPILENAGKNTWDRLKKLSPFSTYPRVKNNASKKAAWNAIVESMMQRHPGSQLPERLISMIRRHFESLPSSYAQAGMDSEQVFMHIRLIEQAREMNNELPIAVSIHQQRSTTRSSNASENSTSSATSLSSWEEEDDLGYMDFSISFATIALPVSKRSIHWAFRKSGISVKNVQIFERKTLLLGEICVHSTRECVGFERILCVLQSAAKKSRFRLAFYGSSQGDVKNSKTSNGDGVITVSRRSSNAEVQEVESRISFAHRGFDEELSECLIDPNMLVGLDEDFHGGRARYGNAGEDVTLERICGNAVEFQKDLVWTCKRNGGCVHRNVLPVRGICSHWGSVWVVSKFYERTLQEFVRGSCGRMELKTVIKIACGVAEGMHFLHSHGVVHSNLRSTNVFLDEDGTAIVGGLRFVKPNGVFVDNHPWPAPEVSGADVENSVITPKTDVYSFGILLWEIVSAHLKENVVSCGYIPPVIPVDCFPLLKYVMQQCFTNNPLDRPDFHEILEILNSATNDITM